MISYSVPLTHLLKIVLPSLMFNILNTYLMVTLPFKIHKFMKVNFLLEKFKYSTMQNTWLQSEPLVPLVR